MAMVKPMVKAVEDFVLPFPESGINDVVEFPLPQSAQTHEIIYVKNPQVIVVSQQTENTLLGIKVHANNGRPRGWFKLHPPWGVGDHGPHGLLPTKLILDTFWCSLQYSNRVVSFELIFERDEPPHLIQIRTIEMPSGILGPHCMAEVGDDLWVTCKDSGHVVQFNQYSGQALGVYSTSPRPIFVAVTPEHIYSSLDESHKILCVQRNSGSSSELSVEEVGKLPVGLVTGPDGHAWFVLLGGAPGTFGRLTGTGIQWLRLRSPGVGGLIHLAFDGEVTITGQRKCLKMFLLGSSMADSSSQDLVAAVKVELES